MTSINLTPRTETVLLLQGDDEAKLRELRGEATRLREQAESLKPSQAQQNAPRTLSEPDTAAEAYAAAVAKAEKAEKAADNHAAAAEKRAVKVVMRSVGRKTWRRLLAENPPRDGDENDKKIGANAEAFGEAMVYACLASPTFSNDEDRDAFLDQLSDAQFGNLEIVAFALNGTVGADPKARLASPLG